MLGRATSLRDDDARASLGAPGVHRSTWRNATPPLTSDNVEVKEVTETETETEKLLLPAGEVEFDMSWFTCETASLVSTYEVGNVLRVDPGRGLSTREADERRQIHGVNEIGLKKQEPLWKKYLDQFNQPFILLLLASAVISVFMKQFDDAISITFAIVIVVTVGFVQVRKEGGREGGGDFCDVTNIAGMYLVMGCVA